MPIFWRLDAEEGVTAAGYDRERRHVSEPPVLRVFGDLISELAASQHSGRKGGWRRRIAGRGRKRTFFDISFVVIRMWASEPVGRQGPHGCQLLAKVNTLMNGTTG